MDKRTNKKTFSLVALTAASCFSLLLSPSFTLADSLRNDILYTLNTNPDILVSINQQLQAEERVTQARSGYGPSIDLTAEIGKENSRSSSTGFNWVDQDRSEYALQLVENLFNGFGTYYGVKANEALAKSDTYQIDNTAENVGLAVSETYLDVLRTRRLVQIARSNVAAHLRTAKLIAKRVESGVSRESEKHQAEGRLALARANLIAEQNEQKDSVAAYIKVVGKAPKKLRFPKGKYNPKMRISKKYAVDYALKHNPAVFRSHYNYIGTLEDHKASFSANFPSLNLVLSGTRSRNVGGLEGPNDNDLAMLELSYNLFSSGSDVARQYETAYRSAEALDEVGSTKRVVMEAARNAWNGLTYTRRQLAQLREHKRKSKLTVNAYRKQYAAGKRTLVDLLNAENEYFSASRSYTNARYNVILSKYRLMNAMGIFLDKFDIATWHKHSAAAMAGIGTSNDTGSAKWYRKEKQPSHSSHKKARRSNDSSNRLPSPRMTEQV